jgi:hypothetical protein
MLAEHAMMSEVEGLSELMFRNNDKTTENKGSVNRELLKKEFDEIDA